MSHHFVLSLAFLLLVLRLLVFRINTTVRLGRIFIASSRILAISYRVLVAALAPVPAASIDPLAPSSGRPPGADQAAVSVLRGVDLIVEVKPRELLFEAAHGALCGVLQVAIFTRVGRG
jgi:hypothetical protein